MLECLSRGGAKRFHALREITGPAGRICFHKEPTLMNNSEEHCITIQPIAPEHGPAGETVQIVKLIQHEILESVVRRCHAAFITKCLLRRRAAGCRRLLDRLERLAQLLQFGDRKVEMLVPLRLIALEFPESHENRCQFLLVGHGQIISRRLSLFFGDVAK